MSGDAGLALLKAEAKARAEDCAWPLPLNSDDEEIARLKALVMDALDADDPDDPDERAKVAASVERPARRVVHVIAGGTGADWDLSSLLDAIDGATVIAWGPPSVLRGGHELTIGNPRHFGGRLFLADVTRQEKP